jgi:hypothetical protein
MATNTDIRKKAMITALEKTLGNVSEACRTVDVHRGTHYDWYNDDPDYRAAVDSVGDIALDFVEGKLFELINGPTREVLTEEGIQQVKDAPTPSAVIFYLKTRGKKRGYIERQEITGADAEPIKIIIPPSV